MAEIKKSINGVIGESLGDYQGKILGQPFLCVYGEVKPRSAKSSELITWPLCGKLNIYVRFRMDEELKDWLQRKEGEVDGSIVLTKQIADHFGVNCTEVMMQAIDFMEMDGINVKSMIDWLVDIGSMPKEVVKMIPDDEPMKNIFVVSTNNMRFGAGVLANTSVLDGIREKHGNFYIIPSSIHEIIIVPESFGMTPEYMQEMVQAVNGSVLEPEDVLSDEVYRFDDKGLHLA